MLNYQKQFPGDPIYMPAQTRTQSSTEEDSNTLVVVVPAWGVLCARPVALRVLRRDNEQGRDRRAATADADRQQDRIGQGCPKVWSTGFVERIHIAIISPTAPHIKPH